MLLTAKPRIRTSGGRRHRRHGKAAASRAKRGNASPNPKPNPSFLSPVAALPRTRAVSSPADPGISFLSSPGSASPNPRPRSRARARVKPAARSPLVASPSAAATPSPAASPAPVPVAASNVGDLKSAVASQLEALKRRLDTLHSRAHADLDASLSRVAKRVKTQNQACQQLTDEVDKEYKKMSDNIKESSEKVKAKYKQIIAEAQSSTTRVFKVTIPKMTKTVEKAIDSLRSRYNISMPA
ncbi:hypothetical protein QOZ80_7AG0565640 [Eleusine coracana subsp. coracana]|nr:hypothetical protein QOZ80_7AG0565640 [Eleusine coracana subsp. coracana]